MEINDFLNNLGINEVPEIENNTCTVFLKDSDIYERIFEKLEIFSSLTQDDVQVTDMQNLITYYGDGLYITLDAQFEEDLYTLTVDKTDLNYEKEGE